VKESAGFFVEIVNGLKRERERDRDRHERVEQRERERQKVPVAIAERVHIQDAVPLVEGAVEIGEYLFSNLFPQHIDRDPQRADFGDLSAMIDSVIDSWKEKKDNNLTL